ncbi:MAG: hypothetical protein QME27_02035 [Syntrophaceae bacterium]|nr:hypothetical protein [Syntrophaceae bacterium]
MDAFLLVATRNQTDGQVYNLGGCEVVNLRNLAGLLVEANGSGEFQVKTFPDDRKRIDIGDYYADDSRARSELGWTPRVDLKEGLRRSLEYYRSNLEHYL